jgi:hypothetical protein
MTIIASRLCLFVAAVTLVVGPAVAQGPAPTAPSESTTPDQNLSDQLSRSNGVIHPKEVDPAIEKPAPDVGDPNEAQPPAGTSGGAAAPQPK